MDLAQWRTQFIAGIQAVKQDLAPDVPSQQPRFAVYRNNYQQALLNVLAATYPCCNKVVGETCFSFIGRRYIANYPPISANLNQYGAAFDRVMAELTAEQEAFAALPYLEELARLEWYVYQSYYAGEACSQDWQILPQLTQKEQHQIRLVVAADVYLMQSRYPIQRIWQRHQQSGVDSTAIIDDEVSYPLVIYRVNGNIIVKQIDMATWQLLHLAQRQSLLGDICAQHSIASQITAAIENGWIVGIESSGGCDV
ncbi:putative DNA-binding domain-containing protein [Shewanella waksmanii]|uniref:HvfC/BufC family peptide modification chaperone n=1 Tax=Shewanella waksmanii TaxID=213783 RepID=UPI003735EB3B